MNIQTVEHVSVRSLISNELFQRLAARIISQDRAVPFVAERIVEQTLAFLGTCAVHEGEPLSPSRMVDSGWHAFVLHTRDYREFCDRVAGRFIDHVPTDDGPVGVGEAMVVLRRTVNAMRTAGYAVDDELWFTSGKTTCTQCKGGCHDDPPPPPTA